MEKNIHRYYKIGDVVRNEGQCGERLFVIHGFGGNEYLPEVYVYPRGQQWTPGNQYNWNVKDIRLIDALKRPLRKIPKAKLIPLMKRNVEEAQREFIIRTNNKNCK